MQSSQTPALSELPKVPLSPAPVEQGQAGARAVVQTIGARLLVQLLNGATGILTARTLMPAGRGQLAAMTLWSLFLAGLTTFGIPSSLIYFLRSKPERRGDLITSGLLMAAGLGVVTGLVGVAFMPHWLHQYPAWEIRDAQWLLIVTPICSLTFVGRAILESNNQFTSSNLAQIISPLTTIILLVFLLAIHHLTVLPAALCYIVAIFPVAGLLIKRVAPHIDRTAKPSIAACKMLLNYGFRSYGVDLLGTLSLQVDQVLVVSILTPAAMGLYVVMLSLSRMANVFQNSVTAVLFPKATGQSVERIIELTGRAARVSLTLTAAVTFTVGVIGPTLLHVFYGKDYTSAILCLRLLLLEVTLSGLVFILAQAFMALDHPGTVSVLQAVGLALSVPLMLLLIPKFGITGAALALLISTTTRLCLILVGFRVYLKVGVPGLIPRQSDYTTLIEGLRRRAAR
jgi:O-antigen/teichoic acid export membrane protein